MDEILKKIKTSDKSFFVGLAGPGTGKTHAFKNIIESDDYKGKNILILSFIKKLVNDLSKDFIDFKNVKVSTLHSFAMQEMKKIIGKIELDPILDKTISEDCYFIENKKIDYAEKFYNNNLNAKEEEFYKKRIEFYKHESGLYSFNSIIYSFNKFFSLPKNKSNIPEYDLILIDEFQDFNELELELIKLLNIRNKIVVVGDDNQSLYFFKNAKPKQIKDLYDDISTESFSLDYCYRCPRVIVDATNNLIENAKRNGFLSERSTKKFLYPEGRGDKDEISLKYEKIDFIPSVSGELLIYQLEKNIKEYIKENGKNKRILIISPFYLKQRIYDGLIKKGINIVEFELFSDEECNNVKHKDLIETFETLTIRKTDNFALRKIIFLYLNSDEIKEILNKNKKIWSLLTEEVKLKIEKDIEIFKKVKRGNKLNNDDIIRFNNIFSLKKILSKLIKGFYPVMREAIEVEMTTLMSSKGLSVDFVCYVSIDDSEMIDDEIGDLTDHKICEFLVGITRAKEKLILISLRDKNPKILEFIDKNYINKYEI